MSIRSLGQKLGPVVGLDGLRLRCRECEDTGCWLWQGGSNADGDGRLYVNRMSVSVSKAAAILSGRIPPPGHVAFNTCRTHDCGNPEHVRVGTVKQKGQFLASLGSMRGPRRSAGLQRSWDTRGRSLSPDQVREIQESSEPLRVFVEKFAVSTSTASLARRGLYAPGVPGTSVFTWRPA